MKILSIEPVILAGKKYIVSFTRKTRRGTMRESHKFETSLTASMFYVQLLKKQQESNI